MLSGHQLIQKLESHDADFKFMALNDLTNLVSTSGGDYKEAMSVCTQEFVRCVLKLLSDQNAEVQSAAIKCTSQVLQMNPSKFSQITETLCSFLSSDKTSANQSLQQQNQQDVAILTLKLVFAGKISKRSPDARAVVRPVVEQLLQVLEGVGNATIITDQNSIFNAEGLSLLLELISNYGQLIYDLMPRIKVISMKLLSTCQNSLVSKKLLQILSSSAVYLSVEGCRDIVNYILSGLGESDDNKMHQSSDGVKVALVKSLCALMSCDIEFEGEMVSRVFVYCTTSLDQYKVVDEDAEVEGYAELCSMIIKVLVAITQQKLISESNQYSQLYGIADYFVTFDPNSVIDHDDDDMMEAEDDEDLTDDEDFEDNEIDYDDQSHLVRIAALQLIYALCDTSLVADSQVIDKLQQKLQSRITDRNKMVGSTASQLYAHLQHYLTQRNSKNNNDQDFQAKVDALLSRNVNQGDLEEKKKLVSALDSVLKDAQAQRLSGESYAKLLHQLKSQTMVDESLVRVVEMGPFKHIIDDGLECRQKAYDCLQFILFSNWQDQPLYDSCSVAKNRAQQISEIFALISQALNDQSREINVSGHQMIEKLCDMADDRVDIFMALVSRRTDAVSGWIEKLSQSLFPTIKDNLVKQELEQLSEMSQSAFKALNSLAHAAYVNSKQSRVYIKEKQQTSVESDGVQSRILHLVDKVLSDQRLQTLIAIDLKSLE
ncbi:hypothetical protein MIR68_003607 [Amoeboaphelidium protococcarum]|nr:hypothetical protein MIR68_003607 [Amoeboaphelidium protococcarum]